MKALSIIWRATRALGRGIGVAGRATVALIGICGVVAAVANYAMTQGSGTIFGSVVVGGIHYAQMFICDLTTPSQCAAVDSSGNVSVKDAAVLAAVQSPVPVNVNGATTAQTGLTPGVAQTGTIVAANVDMTSLGGVAFGAMANYGTSPGAVKVPGTNAFVTNFGTGTAGTPGGGVVTVQGAASMTPLLTQPQAVASGGWTPAFFIAANSNNSTNLKASAGVVHAVQVFGIGAAPAYLKLYDKATAPTCGTDTPVKVIMIPAASTAANGAGAVQILDTQFSTGIGYCVVTGIANNDNTSPAAATFVNNIDWK